MPTAPRMKMSKDGLRFPAKCPLCGSKETVIATYKGDPSKFVECEGCYTVLGEYHGKKLWSKKW